MSTDVALPTTTGRSWHEARGRPSQALPKRTLFGSNLEKHETELVQNFDSLALPPSPKPKPKTNSSPENKAKLPGAQILEHTHEQLCQQEQQACRARDMLDNLEKRSRYFDLKTQQGTTQPHQGHERSEQKMSRKDLENASEINGHIGLNERGSFNYDKYGRKARTHQYSLIGSALTKGMEFPRHDPDYIAYPEEVYVPTTASGPRQYWPQSNQSAENAKRNRSAPATEDLPPNIRHQFGTSVCQAVLADSGKVAETLDGQRRLANSLRRTRVVKTVRSLKPEDTNPQYEALGLALRQNVFPGYTYDHKNSITKTIYNPDVHNNRVPDPDEFRYQRDELSTWAEQNVLRERMKKAWDSFLAGDDNKTK